MTGAGSPRTRSGAVPPAALPAVVAAAALAALAVPSAAAGRVLKVSPADSLAAVSERLASDADVREVVLAAGVYTQSLVVPPPRKTGREPRPLVIRPAAGARVVFDGATAIPGAGPVEGRAGVFSMERWTTGPEPPRLWEQDARVRYALVADLDAVERFASSYVVEGDRVYFHTSDGRPPGDRAILTGVRDFGVLVQRPRVTIRDLEFRNFVTRGRWSTAVRMEAAHVTVERCAVENATIGFLAAGSHGALVDSTARDVGNGVYVSGEDGRVEGCRLLKSRDAFMVETYLQNDSGIEFYYPARAGTARRNLVAGFAIGILIKAERSPWRVERNTVVGPGLDVGLLVTDAHPDLVVRHNVVAGFRSPVQIPEAADRSGFSGNCHAAAVGPAVAPAPEGGGGPREGGGATLVVDDPRFVDPGIEDYRLDPASPCLRAAADGAAVGALPVAADATAGRPPRTWHVSPSGRDGAGGTEAAPVRTPQFAIDRVRPGDTVLLHPGLYTGPVTVRRGGREGLPVTIRAAERGTVILDSNRRAEVMVAIEKAPFVIVRDLEIRWFRSAGVAVRDSPDVTVEGCRIWNAAWDGNWPTGNGVEVERSPGFTGTRNVVFAQERGFFLLSSPGATITHNTALANLYGAAQFIYSIEDSVCRNNSFAFQGNDALVIYESEGGRARLASFDCDYNNYGMNLRDPEPGVAFERIVPREADRHLGGQSKAIIGFAEDPDPLQRFLTLAEWRAFSGRDTHSIVADPLYVSTAARDFRLEPGSPNRGAGSDGATIGAHDGSGR